MKEIKFDAVSPEDYFEFWHSWGDGKERIKGLDEEIRVRICTRNEAKARKIFNKFIQAIKERDVVFE